MRSVMVAGELRAPATDVFAILGDVRNHTALACSGIELLEVSHDGQGRMLGVIDLTAPCGIRRRIATREVTRQSPSMIWGVAAASSGSVALVSWSLSPISEERTRIALSVLPVKLQMVDHALLLLGGRRILSGVLRDTLRRLESLIPVIDPRKNFALDAANSL